MISKMNNVPLLLHKVIKYYYSEMFNFIILWQLQKTAPTTQRLNLYHSVSIKCQDLPGLYHQMALLNCTLKEHNTVDLLQAIHMSYTFLVYS